jgi:collagenase-like PrtC family protease
VNLMVPTNWDDELITTIRDFPVSAVYGKLDSDYFGGGRPSIYIPPVKKRKVRKHIALIHSHGYQFHYLLNASCMGNEELTMRGQYKIYKFIEFLLENGVDSVTVAIPYIARFIKSKYPNLKIKASIIANIDTVEKAKYWEDLGVDGMTLALDCNRNFELLKRITSRTKSEISLIVNLACLKSCPLSQYHYALGSHASQSSHKLKGFYIDYCMLFCAHLRLADLSRIIQSCWIRPEDISFYESIGINTFKITGRILSSDKILKITKAYSERHYKGNLLDILSPFVGQSQFNFRKFKLGLKYMLRPLTMNVFYLIKFKKIMNKNFIEIDNQALSNFLEGLKERNCNLLDCNDCRYCFDIAAKVIKVDMRELEEAKASYKNLLDSIESGRMFKYS